MPHYENMPFELPKGWVWCDITDIISKLVDGTHHSPKNFPMGDFMYVTAKNIKTNGICLDNITYIDSETHNEIYSRCNPEKGDILYIKDGATTGIVTINNLDQPFSLLSSVALIKPVKTVSNEFLCYFLQSSLCYNFVRQSMKGVGITRVTLQMISSWQVPLPPFAEQVRIVYEIKRWFHLIDYVEKKQMELHVLIDQTKLKTLELAIQGKLIFQNKSDEPAIELLHRINPDFTPSDISHYENMLPQNWIIVKLGEIFDHNTGKALNRTSHEGKLLEYITTSNLYWDHFELDNLKAMYFKDGEIDKCTVQKGDLLVCEGGDIGRAAIWDREENILIQNHIHKLRPKFEFCVSLYYYVLMLYKRLDMIGGKGIAIQGLSSRELHNLLVPFPPVNEQKRIVNKIESIFNSLDLITRELTD
jgi:type I restriction enzyme S subunit